MLKENLRKKSGITLVALVVTIVVLLILAGVSINLVLDNNGIVTRAGDARDKTQIEAIKEAKEMYEVEKYLGGAEESLADYLYNKGLISEAEKEIVNAGGTIEKGDYSVSFEAAAKTIVQAFNDGEIEVGDWVNYKNPTSIAADVKSTDVKSTDENYTDTSYTSLGKNTGCISDDGSNSLDQTYSLSNNGKQVNWRVLGLSEDGTQLMLTTGSPLQRDYNASAELSDENNPYFVLSGAKGTSTEYGLKELNKICAIYKNNLAEEVRSLTINDINRLCKVKVDVANGKVTTESDTETNIDGYGNIGTTQTYPNQYESPEDYIEGKGTTASFEKTSDSYCYAGNSAISESSALYDILLKNTDSKFYWLASRAVRVYSDYCLWGPGRVIGGYAYLYDNYLFDSDGDSDYNGAAVRPVVYLRSDITVDDLQKITAPTTGEEDWNYSW